MYLTEQEIMAQHTALTKTYNQVLAQKTEIQSLMQKSKRFVFVGSGSSYMLAKSCARFFMTQSDTWAMALAGGDYLVDPAYYTEAIQGSTIVALSRSGMTTEVLDTIRTMKQNGATSILSVTMKEENDLARMSDVSILLPWAYDHSVCQTRSVTNLYTTALLLKSLCYDDPSLMTATKAAIDQNESYKLHWRGELERIGQMDFDNVIVLADGGLCGIAEEAALAFTEIALVSGKSFQLLDYRHGPKVLNSPKTLTIIVARSTPNDYQKALISDVKAHGGIIVILGEGSGLDVDLSVTIEDIDHFEAWGIPFIYIAQMIALSKALNTNVNPDQPTGLDAYITLK